MLHVGHDQEERCELREHKVEPFSDGLETYPFPERLQKLVRTKKVNTDQVIVFWTTPPYVDYVWTARGGLPQALKEKITAAFLQLDYRNREHRMIMDLQRTKQYARAKDEWWNGIEEAAKAASLIRE